MSLNSAARLPNWDAIRLVAFDVDGTLYEQRRLRARIALDLARHALSRRKLDTVLVLRTYRRIREQMGEHEVMDFDNALIDATAAATGWPGSEVRALVREWIDERPLPYLAACRYPGLPELFSALRRRGKVIGVLSDYPVAAKLAALGLSADHAVYAGDRDVGVLKPHPRGLEVLMAAAGVEAHDTVLIGDRPSRDGLAARRAGAWPLIRSSSPMDGWPTFSRFDGEPFVPLLRN